MIHTSKESPVSLQSQRRSLGSTAKYLFKGPLSPRLCFLPHIPLTLIISTITYLQLLLAFTQRKHRQHKFLQQTQLIFSKPTLYHHVLSTPLSKTSSTRPTSPETTSWISWWGLCRIRYYGRHNRETWERLGVSHDCAWLVLETGYVFGKVKYYGTGRFSIETGLINTVIIPWTLWLLESFDWVIGGWTATPCLGGRNYVKYKVCNCYLDYSKLK